MNTKMKQRRWCVLTCSGITVMLHSSLSVASVYSQLFTNTCALLSAWGEMRGNADALAKIVEARKMVFHCSAAFMC